MKIRACGDAAVLVELDHLADVVVCTAALQDARARVAAVTDLVPAARTVLVRFDPAQVTESAVTDWIRASASPAGVTRPGALSSPPTVEVPVVYDGADLDEVGRRTGLGRDGVVEAHTGTPWTVAFLGFAPGFAYCAEGDIRLRVPRRSTPRTRVPVGAVALAGEFSAIYPRASPGGWQLIGHTALTVWDLEREPPALLMPGTLVRYRAT